MDRPPAQTEIRAPRPDELPRVRELLPQAFGGAVSPTLQVAVLRGPAGRLAAVAAVVPPPPPASRAVLPPAALLSWGVTAEGFRRGEPLACLLAGVIAAAGSPGPLHAAAPVPDPGPEATVLRSLGFRELAVEELFEADPRALWPRLDALHARLAARGLIPPGARVDALRDEHLAAARRLLAAHLPDAPDPADVLDREDDGFLAAHSFALLVDNEVRGLLLCHRRGTVSRVRATLLDPALRAAAGGGGVGLPWAHLVLTHHAIREARRYGVETFRFAADPRLHPNTTGFARLWDARPAGRRTRFGLPPPESAQNGTESA